jgi:hypothetical protein
MRTIKFAVLTVLLLGVASPLSAWASNQIAGPDGRPIPGHNRCGDEQIPYEECPDYQYIARYVDGCINDEEYAYSQAWSIAPICSPMYPDRYVGFCYCGCLERSTQILATDPVTGAEVTPRIDQIERGGVRIHALTEEATLSSVRYTSRDVVATTAGGENNPMVVLQLEGGIILSATEQHAILLASGEMVAAKDLSVGQFLVKRDGSSTAITAIRRVPTDDDVFNVLTDAGLSHKGHMIVANGVIVGDLMWQNTLIKDLNSIIIRQ